MNTPGLILPLTGIKWHEESGFTAGLKQWHQIGPLSRTLPSYPRAPGGLWPRPSCHLGGRGISSTAGGQAGWWGTTKTWALPQSGETQKDPPWAATSAPGHNMGLPGTPPIWSSTPVYREHSGLLLDSRFSCSLASVCFYGTQTRPFTAVTSPHVPSVRCKACTMKTSQQLKYQSLRLRGKVTPCPLSCEQELLHLFNNYSAYLLCASTALGPTDTAVSQRVPLYRGCSLVGETGEQTANASHQIRVLCFPTGPDPTCSRLAGHPIFVPTTQPLAL